MLQIHFILYGTLMRQFTEKQLKDIRILARFIQIYCYARHAGVTLEEAPLPDDVRSSFKQAVMLCPACSAVLSHGIDKRSVCPLEPKPTCRNCRIHCYSPEYRRQIRDIMAFSGRRLIMRGRLDYLWHYFLI